MKALSVTLFALLNLLMPLPGQAATGQTHSALDLTSSTIGVIAIVIFVVAYLLVMAEEFTHLRKSKPVIIAAGVIWALIAFVYQSHPGMEGMPGQAVRHNLLEYAELMLFLLAAIRLAPRFITSTSLSLL